MNESVTTKSVTTKPQPNSSGAVPRHVAIIMDGNNRWARQRQLSSIEGHKAGVTALRELIRYCVAYDEIEVLTAFAFSSENWSRSAEEVNGIMELMIHAMVDEIPEMNRNGVRMHIIGDCSGLSEALQLRIKEAEARTLDNKRMTLVIAVNYGGRWDIVNAAKQMAREAVDGQLSINQFDESQFARHLSLAQFPEPDLCIRTGDERRISNFLLWQIAYAELYFSDALWPDFGRTEFDLALKSFAARQRRFGGRSE